MRTTAVLAGLIAVGALLGANTSSAQGGATPAVFHDDAEITINQGASEDGYVRVAVQPQNGTRKEVTIAITSNMGENDIAQKIADSLRTAVGADYEIDKDSGEHVKIRKARNEVANFAVEITFSARGFSIVIDS